MLLVPRGRLRTSVPLFVIASVVLLLASPFSGHAGTQSRQLVMQVVDKVTKAGGVGGGGGIGRVDEIGRVDHWEYRRGMLYEGTGAGIHAFLDKARSGRPYTVSVIGGSVSKGRGLIQPPPSGDSKSVTLAKRQGDPLDGVPSSSHPPDPLLHLGATTLYSPQNLHVLIFDWLNATFPHAQNRFVNGAQGGVGAGYFSWCFKEHIPEDSDLILVELGVNDLVELDVLGSYEQLIRGLLELPSKPAIINVETFTTLFPRLLSSSALHPDVLAFYDTPSVSIRDVLLPRILEDPDTELPRWFRTGEDVLLGDSKVKEWGGAPVDLMHISALGHALAAGLVIRYLEEQVEQTRPSSLGALGRLAPGRLRKSPPRVELPKESLSSPELRPSSRADRSQAALTIPSNPQTGLIRHDPTCRSMNTAAINSSHTTQRGLQPGEGSRGWTSWSWQEKAYLVAQEPGSLLSIPFVIAPSPAPPSSLDSLDELPLDSLDASPLEAETGKSGRLGFAPLPLAMRPGTVYHMHPVGQTDEMETLGERSPLERQEDDSTGRGGKAFIGYQRSAILGFGSVWCWVDDKREDGTQVVGWWEIAERNMGMVAEVASGLAEGSHILHCELQDHTLDPGGGTGFRIFSVMNG